MSVEALTSQLSVTGRISETLTAGGQSSTLQLNEPQNSYSFLTGTSSTGTIASVLDLHWEKAAVTLASSGTVTYTLSALTDDLGRTVALARVRFVLLQITTKTANDALTIGNAATHPWLAPFGGTTPTITVRDLWLIVDNSPAGLVVTSSSSDQLLITNSGSSSITFNIYIAGNST